MADMPDATSTRPHVSLLTLNNDGQRHPLENSLSVFTLVTGLITFAVGWVVSLHALASVLGIVSLLVGLYAQMISATRAERIIIVTGLVAAFVGTALGFAHGGFWS
jgi:small-conductance mechanosensitive channel